MATNKNAAIRYKVLDRAFRNPGKRYFIEDLIEECNVTLKEIYPNGNGISKRQVQKDIAFIESEEGGSALLERHIVGKRTFYRYADLSFSINNMPLNDQEITQLQLVLGVISQFKGLPQFEFLPDLISRLHQGVSAPTPKEIIFEFDSNEYLKGIGFLGALYNAIHYKQVLQISYKPFENEQPFPLIFHPYYLRQYNSRWFVFGYNPATQKSDWNLALDRIESVSDSTDKYIMNSEIDWAEYFEDIIGVTRTGTDVEDIVLHFYGKTGNYMESKPIHGSQKSHWIRDGILEVRLKLLINYELERLIFSYADTVKVISPERLVNTMKAKLKAGLSLNS